MSGRKWAAGLLGTVVVVASTTLVPTTQTTRRIPGAFHQRRPSTRQRPRPVARPVRAPVAQAAGKGRTPHQPGGPDDPGRPEPRPGAPHSAGRRQPGVLPQAGRGPRDEGPGGRREEGHARGFIPLSAARKLAALPNTGTLVQALKPQTRVGAATSQGVALQRADKVQARGIDGKGITIGALSDSYDTATTTIPGDPLKIHAKQDVASGDLPGYGNPRNSQPVKVLEDLEGDQTATDEGRAMLQIAHDVAPASKLCFATAIGGLIHFADNIRALADKKGQVRRRRGRRRRGVLRGAVLLRLRALRRHRRGRRQGHPLLHLGRQRRSGAVLELQGAPAQRQEGRQGHQHRPLPWSTRRCTTAACRT